MYSRRPNEVESAGTGKLKGSTARLMMVPLDQQGLERRRSKIKSKGNGFRLGPVEFKLPVGKLSGKCSSQKVWDLSSEERLQLEKQTQEM